MDDEQKAQILLKLIQGQLDHFKQTRSLELKVNLAFWTAIVLTGGVLYREGYCISSFIEITTYILLACFIFISHLFCWLVPIQFSEDTDTSFINEYRGEVERLCQFKPNTPEFWKERFWNKYKNHRKGGWTWILAESFTTLLILFCVGIILGTRQAPQEGKATSAGRSVSTMINNFGAQSPSTTSQAHPELHVPPVIAVGGPATDTLSPTDTIH